MNSKETEPSDRSDSDRQAAAVTPEQADALITADNIIATINCLFFSAVLVTKISV